MCHARVRRRPTSTPVTKRFDSIVRKIAPVWGSIWWIFRSRYCPTQSAPSAHVRPESLPLPGAGMVALDWFCSGRVARGERWAFSRYANRTEVFVGDELVLLDAMRLSPEDGPLASTMRTGRYDCLATLILVGEPLRPAVRALLDHFAAAPVQRRASLLWTASALPCGVLLRVAGLNVEAVAHTIWPHIGFLREWLGDDPWARKW